MDNRKSETRRAYTLLKKEDFLSGNFSFQKTVRGKRTGKLAKTKRNALIFATRGLKKFQLNLYKLSKIDRLALKSRGEGFAIQI